MFDKKTFVDGKTFWYVTDMIYEQENEDGDMYACKEFYYMPYKYQEGDEYNFNPERMFDNEKEAFLCAARLTEEEGF